MIRVRWSLFSTGRNSITAVAERIEELDTPLLVCEPVLAEAMHLLARFSRAQDALAGLFENGALTIAFHIDEHISALRKLHQKYRDGPMSLADACIVRMAEIYERHAVLTLDSDFSVYRKHGRVPLVREKGIPPRISEGGSHALCRGDVADLAYRPFRGEPFPGRMRKNGREAKKAGFFIDARCLDRRDLVPAKALAHDVQPLDSGA